jgi:hypothetical protein
VKDRHREDRGREHAEHEMEHGVVGKASLAEPAPAEGGDLVAQVKQAAEHGHPTRALDLLARANDVDQAHAADAIGPHARHAIAKGLPKHTATTGAHRHVLGVLFMHTPDSELDTLTLLVEHRFVFDLGNHPASRDKGKKWDALGLRRLWQVLEVLPPDHVQQNWALARVERYVDTDDKDPRHAHGYYTGGAKPSQGEMAISYRDSIIMDGGTTDHDMEGDSLHGVNRFDEVARHEVGHAVDAELGGPSLGLSATKEAGHWEYYLDHGQYLKAAHEMIAKSNGPIHHLPKHEREQVAHAIATAMNHSSPHQFNQVIAKLENHHELEKDPVYAIMNKGNADQDPWKSTAAIGGRHFHQAYKGTGPHGGGAYWVSYDEAAKTSHRVSEYQFRAIGEWFAECYAAFYTPGEPGAPKGSRLLEKLPQTHAWFVQHVDNKKDVKKHADRARKDVHAPRK